METVHSSLPLWACLVSLVAVIPIVLSGRHPNRREFFTFLAGFIKLGLVLAMLPVVLEGQADRVHHLADPAGPGDRVPGRCLRHALRAGRLVAVDRHLDLFGGLHALAQGALADPLLRLLRGRPLGHPRRGLLGQPASRCISSTRCCRSRPIRWSPITRTRRRAPAGGPT